MVVGVAAAVGGVSCDVVFAVDVGGVCVGGVAGVLEVGWIAGEVGDVPDVKTSV